MGSVVGNTSDALSGPTVHHALEFIYGMAISGATAYFCVGYNEGLASTHKFRTASPQSKATILGKGAAVFYVATDGSYVYWAGQDPNDANKWFVFGTRVGDDSEVVFPAGVPVQTRYGRKYASVIDATEAANDAATGLAVQKTGNYLFVSHGGLDRIDVLNKTAGRLVRTVRLTAPRALAVDGNDELWIAYRKDNRPAVEKYRVGSDGALTLLAAVSGLMDPLALAVSPDNRTLLVADGGSSQQLKAFENASATGIGTPLWTFGHAGGYANGPAVSDDKFFFMTTGRGGSPWTSLAYQPDGSFWVGDPGNRRSQHFSAARIPLDRIMFFGLTYSSSADPNDPTRVFADYMEFKVDYSKPLGSNNGSWTLVRNWGWGIPSEYDDQYYRLRSVTTLSNGRTYALLRHNVVNRVAVVELPPDGPLRFTGVEAPTLNYVIAPDGSLRTVTLALHAGDIVTWSKQELLGFDASHNPRWGQPVVLASTPPIRDEDPVWWGDAVLLRAATTSTGVIASFDPSRAFEPLRSGSVYTHSAGWHLGGIRVGDNRWLWRAAPSTPTHYVGSWPGGGTMPLGNGLLSVVAGMKALAPPPTVAARFVSAA